MSLKIALIKYAAWLKLSGVLVIGLIVLAMAVAVKNQRKRKNK